MKKMFWIALILIEIFIQVQLAPQLFAQAQQDVMPMMGAYKSQTVRVPSTNSSQLLSTAYNTAKGGTAVVFTDSKVRAILLTCETADIRISFGVAASKTGGAEVGHVLAAGNSMRIVSPSMVQKMYFISKTTDTPGVLQVTLEY